MEGEQKLTLDLRQSNIFMQSLILCMSTSDHCTKRKQQLFIVARHSQNFGLIQFE